MSGARRRRRGRARRSSRRRSTSSLVNFANPDMVGHTGVSPAAITRRARPSTPASAASPRPCTRAAARCIVTADHGNAETMLTEDGAAAHAHTTNPVPLVPGRARGRRLVRRRPALRDGRLADVAPTVLDLLGLAQPAAMTATPGRTFALLFPSGSEVRRVSAGRALAKALHEIERPRVIAEPKPTARRPEYSEVVSDMAPDHAIPMLLVGVLGLSYGQVADALDVRYDDVRRRVFLARDTIVRRLGSARRAARRNRRATAQLDPRAGGLVLGDRATERANLLPGSEFVGVRHPSPVASVPARSARLRYAVSDPHMPNERRSARCCGRPRALDRPLRGDDVVAHALEDRALRAAVVVEVEQQPGGPRVAVARLADRARVEQRVAAAADVVRASGAGPPADQPLVDQPRSSGTCVWPTSTSSSLLPRQVRARRPRRRRTPTPDRGARRGTARSARARRRLRSAREPRLARAGEAMPRAARRIARPASLEKVAKSTGRPRRGRGCPRAPARSGRARGRRTRPGWRRSRRCRRGTRARRSGSSHVLQHGLEGRQVAVDVLMSRPMRDRSGCCTRVRRFLMPSGHRLRPVVVERVDHSRTKRELMFAADDDARDLSASISCPRGRT